MSAIKTWKRRPSSERMVALSESQVASSVRISDATRSGPYIMFRCECSLQMAEHLRAYCNEQFGSPGIGGRWFEGNNMMNVVFKSDADAVMFSLYAGGLAD